MVAATLDGVIAAIATVGQGRAALGEAARLLNQGYGRLGDIPTMGGTRDEARSLLDQGNEYAQRIYRSLSDAPSAQSQQLDLTLRRQVQAALKGAASSLKLVEESAGMKYWDFTSALRQVTSAVGETAGTIIGATAGAAGKAGGGLLAGLLSGLGPFWVVVIVITLAVVFFPGRLFGLIRKVV